MTSKFKRLLTVVLSATLALSVTVPVRALRYQGSAEYMSGKYYRALTQVRLTGDQRTDIVNVALSQVGYQEGGNRFQLSGEVYGGMNITEYGRWYGAQDMWCAMFASWCADTAGIGKHIVPPHSYTPEGLGWFRDRGLAHASEELTDGAYEPRPGDLIYFRSSRNKNRTNHVGIVTAFENGRIYTVEGNIGGIATYSNGGMVRQASYPLGNEYIVAVCSPRYESAGTQVLTASSPEALLTHRLEELLEQGPFLREDRLQICRLLCWLYGPTAEGTLSQSFGDATAQILLDALTAPSFEPLPTVAP